MPDGTKEVVEGTVARCGVHSMPNQQLTLLRYRFELEGQADVHQVEASEHDVLAMTRPGDVVRVSTRKGGPLSLLSTTFVENVTTGRKQKVGSHRVIVAR